MSDTRIDDGGPAFPHSHDWGWSEKTKRYEAAGQPGMTLRDWFAGQALASMTVAPDYSKGPCNAAMAERAYVIADAMLSARNKKE